MPCETPPVQAPNGHQTPRSRTQALDTYRKIRKAALKAPDLRCQRELAHAEGDRGAARQAGHTGVHRRLSLVKQHQVRRPHGHAEADVLLDRSRPVRRGAGSGTLSTHRAAAAATHRLSLSLLAVFGIINSRRFSTSMLTVCPTLPWRAMMHCGVETLDVSLLWSTCVRLFFCGDGSRLRCACPDPSRAAPTHPPLSLARHCKVGARRSTLDATNPAGQRPRARSTRCSRHAATKSAQHGDESPRGRKLPCGRLRPIAPRSRVPNRLLSEAEPPTFARGPRWWALQLPQRPQALCVVVPALGRCDRCLMPASSCPHRPAGDVSAMLCVRRERIAQRRGRGAVQRVLLRLPPLQRRRSLRARRMAARSHPAAAGRA